MVKNNMTMLLKTILIGAGLSLSLGGWDVLAAPVQMGTSGDFTSCTRQGPGWGECIDKNGKKWWCPKKDSPNKDCTDVGPLVKPPSGKTLSLQTPKSAITPKGVKAPQRGTPKTKAPSSQKPSTILEPKKIKKQGNLVRVPRLLGMSRGKVERTLKKLGLRPEFKGRGTVVKDQRPRPGTRLRKGSKVKVNLSTPAIRIGPATVGPELQQKPVAASREPSVPLPVPDLTVTSIDIVGGEVRFTVKNIGGGDKPPGRIMYHLDTRKGGYAGPSFERVAALTSLARLHPNQDLEERVVQFPIASNLSSVQVCINPREVVEEVSYLNNCLRKDSKELMPDLEVVWAKISLHPPPKDQSFYEDVKDFLSVEFDTSGSAVGPFVKLRIRNNGVRVIKYFVRVVLSGNDSEEQTHEVEITEPIGPGETRTDRVPYTHKSSFWDDRSFGGQAIVDSQRDILEFDEGNNEKRLIVYRPSR